MGNDLSCKTVGIGTVKIKMHDGIIRTLTEVRHVLELKKNLISIGIMDGKGFKCSTKNGVMKIMDRKYLPLPSEGTFAGPQQLA